MQNENQMVLELCRFLRPNKARLEELMERGLHWPYVLGELLFHRMGGAAYYTLRECGLLGRVNREFRNAVKTAYDTGAAKTASLHIALNELSVLLQSAGFPYALLKGAYLASLYPVGLRTSNDLDILIEQRHISQLEVLLKRHGFVQGHIRSGAFQPASRAEILSSRLNRGETVPFIKRVDLPGMEYLEIDVNFSLDFQARQENDAVGALLSHAQPLIPAEPQNLPTLAPVDFLIHLCCHLYKEAAVYAWVEMERDLSLYKFSDLYLLLNAWGTGQFFAALEERVRAYGLQRECYYALLRTSELFPVSSEALTRLLAAICPPSTAYLQEIRRPDRQKTYRYNESFTDWLFTSGRKEKLYEITSAGA